MTQRVRRAERLRRQRERAELARIDADPIGELDRLLTEAGAKVRIDFEAWRRLNERDRTKREVKHG